MAPWDDEAHVAVQLGLGRTLAQDDFEVWHAGYAPDDHPEAGRLYYWCSLISPADMATHIPVPGRTTWSPPQLRIGWRPTECANGRPVLWQSERPTPLWQLPRPWHPRERRNRSACATVGRARPPPPRPGENDEDEGVLSDSQVYIFQSVIRINRNEV